MSAYSKLSPITQAELQDITTEMQAYIGAQLQDCLQTKSEFALGLYHAGKPLWIWLDLDPHRPMIIRILGAPLKRKKISRPLALFLRSRFLGRRLKSVRVDHDRGRILIFEFHRAPDEEKQGSLEIEFRLFPHGQNVIATDDDKSVSEYKPKELPRPIKAVEELPTPRKWKELEDLWLERQSLKQEGQKATSAVETLAKEYRRTIKKKEEALVKMQEELRIKTSSELAEVGEWLKAKGSLDVPENWQEHIDSSQSLAWNIERCFHRAKENLRKAEGTRDRLALVEKELDELKAGGLENFVQSHLKARTETQKKRKSLLAHAEARGRRFQVAEGLEAYIGRSAADNLALLRRAQPFDYWLHLRDQPGSHAILRRTRGRQVRDEEFRKAGTWVIEQSVGKRAAELKGERFDLLIVECRFVRPIKGDKLGRVNYSNDRVISLKF